MSKKILIVDDEKQILKALNRTFMESGYDVFLAEGGNEGLEILASEKIDLIISDMRMPEMDGEHFLRIAKERYPNVIRIMLSGYSDEKTLFKALQNSLVKLYLFKPWDNTEITSIIEGIFQIEEELTRYDIFDLVTRTEDLPTVDGIYRKLCSLIEEDANIDEISDIISKDQSTSTRILRIINSAYYGVKTGDIKQAILYLGLTNLKSVVLSTTIFDNLKSNTIRPYLDLFWKHANLTNRITTWIYGEFLDKKMSNDYSSAGLLHDIGKIIIINNFNKQYEDITKQSKLNKDIEVFDEERKLFGFSHQELGGYLLNWWELPYPIIEVAMFHHIPLDKKIVNKELVSVVHLANYYSWKLLDQHSEKGLDKGVFDLLSINEAAFENCINMRKKSLIEGA